MVVFAHRLARSLLCLWFVGFVFAAEPGLDERLATLLAAHPPVARAELEGSVRRIPEAQRLVFLTVGLELVGEAADRVTLLAPLLVGREQAAAQPFLAISLADALARTGAVERAETVLSFLPDPVSGDLDQADRSSVLAQIALQRQQLSVASSELQDASEFLRQAVPEVAYETWRSRLVRQRLDQLGAVIASAAVSEAAGPACQAWLQADRAGTAPGYQGVVQRFPKTLFADAGQLELAQLQFREGHLKEALITLDEPRLARGPLAAAALLLRGDIHLVAGRPAEARKALEAALAALTTAAASSGDIDERALPFINPSQALHRLTGRGYIVWDQRPSGAILAPAAHADTAAYLRYQILVRLAVLARCGGDAPTAVALARALLTFDATDRTLDQRNRSSGSSLLAYTCETGKFIMPVELADGLPEPARILLWLGVAFYQVEDWRQARGWSQLAAERIAPRQVLELQTAQSLIACSEQMLNRYDEALVVAAQVQLKPGQAPHRAWFVARLVESEIYSNRGQQELFMACQEQIRKQAKGTEYARDALQAQAAYVVSTDFALARRLLAEHEREFPGQDVAAIQFLRDRIDEFEKQKAPP